MNPKFCEVCETYYSAQLKKCPFCQNISEQDLRVWF